MVTFRIATKMHGNGENHALARTIMTRTRLWLWPPVPNSAPT